MWNVHISPAFAHFIDEESEAHRSQEFAKVTVLIGCPSGNMKLAYASHSGDFHLKHSCPCVHSEGRLKLFKGWKLMKYEESRAVRLCVPQLSTELEIVGAPLWV